MKESLASRITPVILSGGAGTRLWPLSRGGRPKQMLALAGEESMLRLTVRRVADTRLYEPPVIVAAAGQAGEIEAQVPGLGRLIPEPVARNTAPAIALAALALEPQAVLLVLPSDHRIGDVEGFNAAIARTLPLAQQGWIVTFGRKPDRAETGYGYIKRGPRLAEGVFAAERFVEKPDAATARDYLADGSYDWNSGIFLMRADTLLRGLEMHAPEILAAARNAMDGRIEEGVRLSPDAQAFSASPSVSIDFALMEKADKVAVVPVSVDWSDIGSWEALLEVSDQDGAGNALAGDAMAIDSSNCLIRSDGPLVAAIGVEDLVIVATADAVLVVPRTQSQRVKEIVDRLKAEGRDSWT